MSDSNLLLTHRIKPEGGLYLAGDDHLHFAVYSSVSSQVVTFSGYLLNKRGEIVPYSTSIVPTSDRAATTTTVMRGECFLLSCVAVLSSGNASRGQTYIRARIQKSSGTPATPYAIVLAGYLTDEYSPSFPGGKQEGPLEGPGMIRSITGTNPAAGAEISEAVPTGARWRLLTFQATLTADGTVATREIRLLIDDGATTILTIKSPSTQAASSAYTHLFAIVGAAQTQSNNLVTALLPYLRTLPAAYRITTACVAFQAGDDWSAPQLLVEEWLEA